MTDSLDQLDVFYGDLTPNRAYIYARLPRPADDAGLRLSGHVRGPRCLHAQTLPSAAQLVDQGPGRTLLARATMPEPCFWSPDLPAIYDVVVNLQRGAEIVATTRREIGLRSLGIRNKQFVLAGKAWVIRGVRVPSTIDTLPRAWHDAAATCVLAHISEETLAEASQWGALSIVEISASPPESINQLRQLATYPAAALAVIHGQLPAGFTPSDAAPNLLLAQKYLPNESVKPQPWAHAVWLEIASSQPAAEIAQAIERPILIVRPLATKLPMDQARAACDDLQRDLAPIGQFAGYIV